MLKQKLKNIIRPVSQNEDKARSEFILNVLLLACISLSAVGFLINAFKEIAGLENSVPSIILFIVLSFFVLLFIISRKGFFRLSAYCLLATLFLLVTQQIYTWGADLPSALLSYVLIIVMAGILVSTRFAFITAGTISLALIAVSELHARKVVLFDSHWKTEFAAEDVILFIVIFLIIATVSWLSNREIERSLKRARKSEAELKNERDNLEIIVEEKTKELKETQAEKMAQLYRFAEFGRLSSGLFHDLVNPLSAVSLNMEQVKNEGGETLKETKNYVERALAASRKMEDLVVAVRKQLSREENNSLFEVKKEIQQVIEILHHKARENKVKISLHAGKEMETFGDATKFHYALLNIIINSVDAYAGEEFKDSDNLAVDIYLAQKDNNILITVQDHGSGINPENLGKIFEPFFTTKINTKGIGIGLSTTKRIIERDFGGTIKAESEPGKGAKFMIKIPVKIAPKN